MRIKKITPKLTVHAVAGTYVVMLGMDMPESEIKDLLGFAIRRKDHTENEDYWLTGMRTFEASYPNPPEGALVSTRDHPVQDFLWSDFTAKPGRKYTYEVVPVRGVPRNLEYGDGVELTVETESERSGTHDVYFNRAVIGSQAYARKFVTKPSELPPDERKKAMAWLSRGLYEAIVSFLGEAKDSSYELRAAVYEFDYEPIIEEFGRAHKRCGGVKLVYDARGPESSKGADSAKRVAKVRAMLKKHGLSGIATPRESEPNAISHNKFVVLLKSGVPIAVWTGSTNFTASGIFGHANVGHVVRDKVVARHYLEYWERLQEDPASKDLRKTNEQATPTLTDCPPPKGITPLFSPRSGKAQLEWYGQEMDAATNLVCFTAAFGVNMVFRDVLKEDRDYLRYLFLEKWGVNEKSAAETEADLSNDRDIQVAVGATIKSDVLYEWLPEITNPLSRNVKYVHTKFLLVDPLGDDPVVVTGSANFSDASTSSNDENMLVIRGDTRVADIYLGEFMRLWRHHRFRFIVNKISEKDGTVEGHNYLSPTNIWAKPFFKAGTVKFRRRETFAP